MAANSVSVAAVAIALTVTLFGAAPAVAAVDAATRPVPSAAAATKIAAGLWAPKKAAKPKARANEDDSAREEELLRSKSAPAARPRRRIKMEDSADSASEDEEEEEEEEEERPKKKRRKVAEEEEEDEDEEEDVPLPSLPVIRPRLASGFLAAGIANRNFKYNTPLQGDSGYRMGYSFSAELYPLLLTPPGKHRHIGIGFHYDRQSGTAGRYDMATGSTITYPVKQTQWGFDVRYFFALGPRVVLAPAVGYGRVAADLGRRTPVGMPSSCLLTNSDPCFADLNAAYVPIDIHVRIAATETLGFSIAGGYLFGLGVQTGADQISSMEASATVSGFHANISTHLLIKDWFALQATIPVRRYAYKLSPLNTVATYSGATDTYWGVIAGVVFLAP